MKGRDAGAEPPEGRLFEALVRFDDADAAAVLAKTLEPDRAGDLRKERVILSAADVTAGMNVRAALAPDNGTGGDEPGGDTLDAESLTVAVATVLGTAYAFFVSHASPAPV